MQRESITANLKQENTFSLLFRQLSKKAQKIMPFLFLTPNMFIFTIFIILPCILGIYYSFTDFDGLNPPTFIGMENYIRLFKSRQFWEVFQRTFIFAFALIPSLFSISLLAAMYLVKKIRYKSAFRALIYWPTLISYVVVGMCWRWILSENFGVINHILQQFSISPVSWLTDTTWANISVVTATAWSRLGFYMVLFIGGLQGIPTELYESAEIDGTSKFNVFRYITFPMLKPTSLMVIILSTIDAFKAYGLVVSLTGGGPGKGTTFLVQYIYEFGFTRNDIGMASAMSVILLVILSLFTIVQYKFSGGGEINA